MRPRDGARRTLGSWLLAVFLERGCDPVAVTRRHHEPVFAVRALSARERRELCGPPLLLHFLPQPRRRAA
jgi:hypothetical protein